MERRMISQIRGRVVSASPHCVVDVGGVGFELLIPTKDVELLSPDDGDRLFHTYLHVREDRLQLFGFLERQDRELFLRLIDVSGVGPKLALGVLSVHPATHVVIAIKRTDTAFLKKMPGLGQKTAERLCMELADKLNDIGAATEIPMPGSNSSMRDEIVMALASLGMMRGSAEAALEKMNWSPNDDIPVEEVVREALRYAGS
jgi:Holliday junction DNA helicase RuvA